MPKFSISNVNSRAAGTASLGTDQGPDVLDPIQLDTTGAISMAAPGTARSAGYDTVLSRLGPGVVGVTAVGAAAPTATLGAGAGTAPPAAVVLAGSTDARGSVTAGTGTTPAAGALVNVVFSRTYATIPFVNLTETTTAASLLNPAVTTISTTGFTISVGTAPAASQGAAVYGFEWSLTF
jgi:hypothetical protein